MSKETKKRDTYNKEILIAVAEKYGVSVDYVRKCLKLTRIGIVPDKIIKEYKEGSKRLNEIVETTVEEFKNK